MDRDDALLALIRAIAQGDRARVSQLLDLQPELATARLERRGATRQESTDFFLDEVSHYVYAGDTALHVAACAYDEPLVRALVERGADVGATNRRGAQPLHYAADGTTDDERGHQEQHDTVVALIELGADPHATDKNGATPLHRAARTRRASAVAALLDKGADPAPRNKNGSTPADLATRTTGRGGSGSPVARARQEEILRLLRA
jgi:hypothetical protein